MKATLLITLFNLWKRMGVHKKDDAVAPAQPSPKRSEGMLERYNWFINNSNMGDDCTYARKCADLFISNDYDEIKKLFLECLDEFRKIEGAGFGR